MHVVWERLVRAMKAEIVVRCNEQGFDCTFSTIGEVNKVVFDYWDHMKKEHGIEYSPGTLGAYLKQKIPTQIPVR